MQDQFDSWRRTPVSITAFNDDTADTDDMEDQAHTPVYPDNPLASDGASTPRASFGYSGLNRSGYSGTPPGTPPYPMGGVPTATPKKPGARHAAKRARSGSSVGLATGSQIGLQASTDNLSLRNSTAAMKRRDSGFLSRLPSSRPEPPLHRQGSEKFLTRGSSSGGPASTTTTSSGSARSEYTGPFTAAGAKMKIDPTPQKEKVLKLNVNPYTPPTSTGATSHGYPLEMKVAVENASRYLMEFSTEEALGQGSFGKVDLAKNRLDGWSYAIKRLQYKPSKSSVALDTVMNEIFMLASLSHPHIVRYYSAWIDEAKEEGGDSEVCIQTEFCFGGSLSKWWKKWLNQPGLSEVTKASRFQQNTQTRLHHQPRFHHPSNNVHLQAPYGFGPAVPQVDEAHRAEAVQRIESKLCEILRHICKALQYLHQEKFVVHLDVKPDNILVQQDTLDLETATFKLGDFGSMRKIPANEPAESPRSHMAGVFSGSPILATESASKGSKPGFGGTPFASSGFAAALATPSFKGQQANSTNTTTSGPSSVHTSPVQNLFHAGQEAPTTPTSSAPSSAATTPVLSRREGHVPSVGQFTPPQLQLHSMNGVLATPSRNLLTPAAVMAHTIESDDIEEGDGRYLAPEFLAESGGLIHTALLPLADIYALGCSIVELAHAALGSGNDVVLPGCFSPAFRELVECMMAPQPANRPSAAQLLQHELLLAPEIFQMRMEMEMMRERMAMMERQVQHLQQQQQGSGFLSASHRNLSAPLRCSQTSLNFPPSNGFAGTYSSHGSFGKTSGQTSWARRDITENRGN